MSTPLDSPRHSDPASTSLITGERRLHPEEPPNQTLAPVSLGDYELLEELGRGGMGVVHRARQQSLGRMVALKMVLNSQTHATVLARFQQEARAAASLDHPGIVPIFDFGELNGQPYYTMAFIEGDNLAGMLRKQGPLPPRQAAKLILRITEAVAYAHERGILHRDLKPDNVLVDRQGHPRITDFGLARRLDAGANLTNPGSVIGTPAYMAPEQARGEPDLTAAVDIYSLGAVLHALLVGQPPFSGDSVYTVLLRVTQEPPPPLRQFNPALPEALELIVLRCLEKDPARRYPSAADLAADLRSWLDASRDSLSSTATSRPGVKDAFVAPTVVTREPAAKTGRGRRLILGGVLVALLAGAAAAGWHFTRPAADATPDEPEAVAWEKPGRQDFPLNVSLPGLKPNDQGVFALSPDKPIHILIQSPRDVYVGVWTLQDDAVIQLFPNDHEQDQKVRANIPRVIPGNDEYDILPEPAARVEFIRVVASTAKWAPPRGEKIGPFPVFRGKERRLWEIHQRGLVIRSRKQPSAPAEASVSEVVLPYRVK